MTSTIYPDEYVGDTINVFVIWYIFLILKTSRKMVVIMVCYSSYIFVCIYGVNLFDIPFNGELLLFFSPLIEICLVILISSSSFDISRVLLLKLFWCISLFSYFFFFWFNWNIICYLEERNNVIKLNVSFCKLKSFTKIFNIRYFRAFVHFGNDLMCFNIFQFSTISWSNFRSNSWF